MKIWYQHSSEHSANLVMIGHFKNAGDAMNAKKSIDALTKQVAEERSEETLTLGSPSPRFGNAMLDLLVKLNVMTIGPSELEQFAYEFSVELQHEALVLKTEEIDISAFFKVMFGNGARVEVFSAHDYPDTGHGRG